MRFSLRLLSCRSLFALLALSFACLKTDPPSAPVVAAKLAFIRGPTNTSQGFGFAPFVQVAAQDPAGNTATGFTGVITLTLGGSNPGATLSGNAVAVVNGAA